MKSQVRSRKGARTQLVLVAAITVGVGAFSDPGRFRVPTPATAAANSAAAADRDCDDFSTQQQAENFFEANGGPGSDPHQLDGDGDGRACEDLPCPCGSGGGGGGGGDTGGGGGGGGPADPPRDLTDAARVTDIADGDTIEVRVHGRSRDVRLVGIDTPEVYGGTECGGPEASAAMKRLLQRGDKVRLVRDPSQDAVDRYGRLLRYVEHGGRDVGRKQILRGRARVYVYDGNPFKRVSSYRRAQRKAKHADRGNWGECGGRFRAADSPVHTRVGSERCRATELERGRATQIRASKETGCGEARQVMRRWARDAFASGTHDYVLVHDHAWFCAFTRRVDGDTRRSECIAGLHGRIRAWVSQ